MAKPPPEFKYWAFLSYSHGDARWAAWLHHAIETYSGHKKLVGKPNKRGEPVPARLFPVFRDREELEGVPDLPARIQEALVQSRHLVVLCSPRAAASRWVNEEIRAFKALGREDRVLAFIVGGEPNASDHPESGLQECFPEALRTRFDAGGQATGERAEPGAPDAREGKDGRRNALVKIVARLLGVELDELRQRDLERRRRRWFLLSAGLMVLVLVLTGLTVYAFHQKDVAEQAQKLAADNEKLALRNAAEATQQRDAADTQRGIAQQRRLEAERERAEAVRQRDLAEQRARIALSRQLAADVMRDLAPQTRGDARQHNLAEDLLLASHAVRAARTVEAYEALLAALVAGNRPFQYLWAQAGGVSALAISPDGNILAAGGKDGTLLLWDLASRRAWAKPKKMHFGPIRRVAFSHDGQACASASDDTLALWRLAQGSLHGTPLRGPQAVVRDLAFSPGAGILATAGADSVVLWDLASGKPAGAPLGMGGSYFERLAFSADGRLLATADTLGALALWDVAGRKRREGAGNPHVWGQTTALAFSPGEGGLLAAAGEDGTVALLDPATLQPRGEALPGHRGGISSLAFSADGTALATAGEDGAAMLWNVASRRQTGETLRWFRGPASAVAFAAGGLTLAAAGSDGSVILSQAPGANNLGEVLLRDLGPVTGLAAKGETLALVAGGRLILWDGRGRRQRTLPQAGQQFWQDPAFSPDGKTLALMGNGGVVLLDVASLGVLGKPLAVPSDDVGFDSRPVFSPDGKTLAVIGSDRVFLFDLASRKPAKPSLRGPHDGQRILSLAFSPDRKTLASASDDGTVMLWDAQKRQLLEALRGGGGAVGDLAFSPDGATLVAAGRDGGLRFWDVQKHRLRVAKAGDDWARRFGPTRQSSREQFGAGGGARIAFSPDGKTLVSTGGGLTVWDVAQHRALVTLPAAHHQIAFGADGQTLVSSGSDGQVILWDMAPESWVRRACRAANRNLGRKAWALAAGGTPYRPACPELPAE